MLNFETENLKSKIKQAMLLAIEKIKEKMPESEICGVALYSDSDATGLAPSFNCRSHLKKMQEKYPEDPIYFKWSPAEWSHESFGVEYFSEICNELRKISDSTSEGSDFQHYRVSIFDTCVLALKEIQNTKNTDTVFVFSATDYESPQEEISWIKKLNPAPDAEEFETWLIQQQ